MMKYIIACVFAIFAINNALAFSFNDCKKASFNNEIVNGYNCNLPDDATGPGLVHSERVNGKVTWASERPNRHGLYEFELEYAYFQMRGFSRKKPRIGDTVQVIIRAVLYPGLVNFDN